MKPAIRIVPAESVMDALMLQILLRVLAWSALACIAFVTLSAIGLRPVLTANPLYERFAAFAILAALFGLAYPGRTIFAIVIVVGSAMSLEALQLSTPDRHGHVIDFVQKASGGLVGIVAINVLRRYPPFATLRPPV
jgi:hypothetical protein